MPSVLLWHNGELTDFLIWQSARSAGLTRQKVRLNDWFPRRKTLPAQPEAEPYLLKYMYFAGQGVTPNRLAVYAGLFQQPLRF